MRKVLYLVLAFAIGIASSAVAADTKPTAAKSTAPATKVTAQKAEKSKKQVAKAAPKQETAKKSATPEENKAVTDNKTTADAPKEKSKSVKSAAAGAEGDLMTVISGKADLKTISNLLQASGLADELKSAGPFTILAPTDAAFSKLPEDKLLEWLKPKNKSELRHVIGHHLIPGKLALSDFAGKQTTQNTVQGGTVDITGRDDGIFVNKSKINAMEIPAANGVILVIDGVLQPNSSYVPDSTNVM